MSDLKHLFRNPPDIPPDDGPPRAPSYTLLVVMALALIAIWAGIHFFWPIPRS
ncbi:hypothetical protein N5W20_00485 [Candidatus Kirkpatrickella diaphorinae]|uniref:Uncharacterized protein n=3 Tax=Acetobacteraceae TaxID=433 RepID=A0ABY6GIQ7_9PROT|nr:hypothetical protein [Candidatus Kirkpatrickella diaphorinae]UYH51395.1 hypothetical protein N5W20_00485 [Candidatus Kirkpatrickella diaphorinae]